VADQRQQEIQRQAVVIIHGIGEQRPMQTLRNLVDGVLADYVGKPRFWSKPDRISDTLELRRLVASRKAVRISTDFYELYWAHLMTGTSWKHVIAWIRVLLLRLPTKVPKRLLPIWFLSWLLVVGAGLAIWQFDLTSPATIAKWGALGTAAFFLVRLVGKSLGLHYAGDAARYLSATPDNIAVRHSVRSQALTLLRGLHADPLRRYDRIIVVGHSLGSVIAYDAISHLWQETHDKHGSPPVVDQHAFKDLEALIHAGAPDPAAFRQAQRALWSEQRALGIDWRITDLVTLGSPLAHANFLMADDETDFAERVEQRVLPTCPPTLEDGRDIGYLSRVYEVGDQKRTIRLLHHAAPFACTRWTNLYFPGDIIGGPVAPRLGWGVEDHKVRSKQLGGLGGWLWSSHTRYWRTDEGEALGVFRTALNLGDA
jgi:hypothetical protein